MSITSEYVRKNSICYYSDTGVIEERVLTEKLYSELESEKIISQAPENTAAFRVFYSLFKKEGKRLIFEKDKKNISPFCIFRGIQIHKQDLKKIPTYFPQQVERIFNSRHNGQQLYLTELERGENLEEIVRKKAEIYTKTIPEYFQELYKPFDRQHSYHLPVDEDFAKRDVNKIEVLRRSMEKYSIFLMATTSRVHEFGFSSTVSIDFIGEAEKFKDKLCRDKEEEVYLKFVQERDGV